MRQRQLACFSVCLALSACAVGPDYQAPQTSAPKQFANAATDTMTANSTEIRWWEKFADKTLNTLVADGLRANPDLRIATANLREARAARQLSQFDFYPTVTLSASEKSLQRSKGIFGSATNPGGFDLLNTGFDATWELDFFGRIRRSVESQTAEMESFDAQRRDAIVSLVSELARNYFELRGTQHQLSVARKNAGNQAATLKYTQARLSGGQGTALDTARAEEQWNSTLAIIPPLEASIRHAIHRLSVLVGKTPEQLYGRLEANAPLPQAPKIIGIGDPAKLLQRRPDVRVAERGLAAATAQIGVATADLFPRVSFVGNIALEARSFAGLGASGGDTYSFGPSIRWAAFDLGRVYTRIKAADAHAEGQLALYEKTVLGALEETENALLEYGKLQQRREYFRAAVVAGEKAAYLARLRYQDGVADFLAVLDAERRLLETQDRLAQTETDTATALISVYKALGGGWE
ncbi:MAG: efflux transporter outer membrane subunit [Methylovulum sp.]|uniref:efflux transporter outer membrane subunit n=1 Tax=Methylovulum sp. TaxID=1916980 RepID=UPI00260D4167|nr:efflux transporter outer membrane subunit [Methylovulum sp.]MDD2725620.1 efflux transporter outer membrane subunit [Methylovulum sp.]MDD5125801.1 efflux transporter outer membrane subunit [Methylovulum sp.]